MLFRAQEAAARTAASLAAAGHAAVPAPVTRIVRPPVTVPAGRVDALLATSANAFPLPQADEGLRRHPVFVVGRATAEAARTDGFHDTRIAQGDGASLVTLLRLTLPRPARLLYLAGHDRKPIAEAGLADAGFTLDTLVVYAAEASSAWPDAAVEAVRDGAVDAALHFSRRSAALALAVAARHDILPAFAGLMHCCLSQDVAAPLREAGAMSVRIAERPEESAMLESLPPGRA